MSTVALGAGNQAPPSERMGPVLTRTGPVGSLLSRRGPHASPHLPALFYSHTLSLLAYLVPILARAQAKDSVT